MSLGTSGGKSSGNAKNDTFATFGQFGQVDFLIRSSFIKLNGGNGITNLEGVSLIRQRMIDSDLGDINTVINNGNEKVHRTVLVMQ